MYYKDSFGSSSQKSKEKESSNPAFFKDRNAAIKDIAPKNVIVAIVLFFIIILVDYNLCVSHII